MRVLMAGDTHGNLHHWKYILGMAKFNDCELICQLGDFGFWEHTVDGSLTLDKLSKLALAREMPIYWIDGNHENHTLLRSKYDLSKPPVEIRPNIYHLPRGYRWQWGDNTLLACGGAYSIDKEWRRPGSSWWTEEMITDEEVDKCIEGGKVDILLSHDVPQGVDITTHFAMKGISFFKADKDSEKNRRQLHRIVEEVRPGTIFHGHFHIRYSDRFSLNFGNNECRVEGLACDEMGKDSWLVVDL